MKVWLTFLGLLLAATGLAHLPSLALPGTPTAAAGGGRMGAATAQSDPPAGRLAAPPGAAGGAIRSEFPAAGQPLTSEHRGYAYDAAWNLAWRTNAFWLQRFQVQSRNQLTNSTEPGQQTYDANGNLLGRLGTSATTTRTGSWRCSNWRSGTTGAAWARARRWSVTG